MFLLRAAPDGKLRSAALPVQPQYVRSCCHPELGEGNCDCPARLCFFFNTKPRLWTWLSQIFLSCNGAFITLQMGRYPEFLMPSCQPPTNEISPVSSTKSTLGRSGFALPFSLKVHPQLVLRRLFLGFLYQICSSLSPSHAF